MKDSLLAERETTHGDFTDNAHTSQAIKNLFRSNVHGWRALNERQREALDMIACKIGRILSGDPYHKDHWLDICGYAKLALDEARDVAQVGSAECD